jgi:hypothetical protein
MPSGSVTRCLLGSSLYISDNTDVSPELLRLPQIALPSLAPPLYRFTVLFFLATNHKYRKLSSVLSPELLGFRYAPRGVYCRF